MHKIIEQHRSDFRLEILLKWKMHWSEIIRQNVDGIVCPKIVFVDVKANVLLVHSTWNLCSDLSSKCAEINWNEVKWMNCDESEFCSTQTNAICLASHSSFVIKAISLVISKICDNFMFIETNYPSTWFKFPFRPFWPNSSARCHVNQVVSFRGPNGRHFTPWLFAGVVHFNEVLHQSNLIEWL